MSLRIPWTYIINIVNIHRCTLHVSRYDYKITQLWITISSLGRDPWWLNASFCLGRLRWAHGRLDAHLSVDIALGGDGVSKVSLRIISYWDQAPPEILLCRLLLFSSFSVLKPSWPCSHFYLLPCIILFLSQISFARETVPVWLVLYIPHKAQQKWEYRNGKIIHLNYLGSVGRNRV